MVCNIAVRWINKRLTVCSTNNYTSVVANYMMWQTVFSYMSALSEDFKKVILEYKKAKSGAVQEEPQWRECMTATSSAFGMPLGLLYINEKFSGDSKAKVSSIVEMYLFL